MRAMRLIVALAFIALASLPRVSLATEADLYWASGTSAPVFQPITSMNPLPVTGTVTNGNIGGFDSGAVYAEATPANSSHAAGTSIGGLFTIALPRTTPGSGINTNLLWKSTGGSTGTLAVRVWQKNPSHTTCTDNVAYSTTDETDDRALIVPPTQTLTPIAASSTTGDAATYAWLTNLVVDYKSSDGNIYACAVTVATDTLDENKLVRLIASGPQN